MLAVCPQDRNSCPEVTHRGNIAEFLDPNRLLFHFHVFPARYQFAGPLIHAANIGFPLAFRPLSVVIPIRHSNRHWRGQIAQPCRGEPVIRPA